MEILARNWWALVLRGVLGIVFGIFAFVMPAVALAALVVVFGAYALVDGLFNIVAALRGARGERAWWAVLLEGVAGVLAGLAAFLAPGLTAIVLLYVIAAWAILTGAFEVVAAVRLRQHISDEWLMGLSGVLSILFGVLVMVVPAAGALALVFLIGTYAFVSGLVLVALGFRLRGAARPTEREMRQAA
jgi:uncharacterized membrane protein HdeD (DUF308 family)